MRWLEGIGAAMAAALLRAGTCRASPSSMPAAPRRLITVLSQQSVI